MNYTVSGWFFLSCYLLGHAWRANALSFCVECARCRQVWHSPDRQN